MPNIVGAVALGAACRALADHGMERVLAHERHLDERMRKALDTVEGLTRHHLWGDDHPRIAVQTFTLGDALGRVAYDGPPVDYQQDPVSGNWSPAPDDGALPDLACLPQAGAWREARAWCPGV